jgi:hypothetical protein
MLKRYTEYREMQQLRKDHLKKQRMRYGLIFFAIMGVLLIAISVVEAVSPAAPAKSTAKVSTVDQQKMQEKQEIQEFAYIVTKPIDELTSEEIDAMGAKAGDPCYEKNALLPEDEMVEAILACKYPK